MSNNDRDNRTQQQGQSNPNDQKGGQQRPQQKPGTPGHQTGNPSRDRDDRNR